MAADLAQIFLDHRLDGTLGTLFFLQDHFADNRIHIGVGQLYLNHKAAHQTLQVGGIAQGTLPCGNKQHLGFKGTVFTAGFDDLLHHMSPIFIATNKLLHFIQHDEGQR